MIKLGAKMIKHYKLVCVCVLVCDVKYLKS